MGLFSHVSSLRVQANAGGDQFAQMHSSYVPTEWLSSLSASGIPVSPDGAMKIGAYYAGVRMIARELGTLPAQTFKNRTDGGKDKIAPQWRRGEDFGGIGRLAYLLRWQPNSFQSSPEFWMCLLASFLTRQRFFAEIVEGGLDGAIGQILPRHPDRVTVERMPDGSIRYRLAETNGKFRYVEQEWMFTATDMSLDGGMTPASMTAYGAESFGTALAVSRAAGKFFKSGMTASTVATYKGDRMEDEEELALHASISRYAAGVDNSFGLLLVPDSIELKNLAIEPEKAQMMLAQEWSVREVARFLNLPGHKLGIKDAVSYNSQVQAALEYVISCLRPVAVILEHSIQRDLILAKDSYVVEFLLAGLLRGDFGEQAEYLEKLIRSRVMRPSEARLILNMNPDEDLDALSARDNQPGRPAGTDGKEKRPQNDRDAQEGRRATMAVFSKGGLRAMLAVHDNAVRCQRRERAAVERLSKKHASDVDGWRLGLRDFMADHAGFIAQTMRVPIEQAREYAARHGQALEDKGVVVHTDDWEREAADELAFMAIGDVEVAA